VGRCKVKPRREASLVGGDNFPGAFLLIRPEDNATHEV
jgi:hypothetical protein